MPQQRQRHDYVNVTTPSTSQLRQRHNYVIITSTPAPAKRPQPSAKESSQKTKYNNNNHNAFTILYCISSTPIAILTLRPQKNYGIIWAISWRHNDGIADATMTM